jgi:hypothetical protein
MLGFVNAKVSKSTYGFFAQSLKSLPARFKSNRRALCYQQPFLAKNRFFKLNFVGKIPSGM